MTIRVYYDEKKEKILVNTLNKEAELGFLCLGIALGGPKMVKEKYGEDRPDIIIEGYSDEKMHKAVKELEELLDKVY